MQYGQLLGGISQNSNKNDVYKAFLELYNNPDLTKVKDDKNVGGGTSIYMVKIHTLLANTNRYLAVTVPIDKEVIGTTKSLSTLPWSSFQARTLAEPPAKLKPYHYMARRGTLLDDEINKIDENKEGVIYAAKKLPLTITLLNTPDMVRGYNEKGTILNALETFNTIITFKK